MRNEYLCSDCQLTFTKYDVHHDPPVGSAPDWPPTGNGEWEAYMLRVDCDAEYLQLLCHTCHLKAHERIKQDE